jgi:hypothetical protein
MPEGFREISGRTVNILFLVNPSKSRGMAKAVFGGG